MIFRTEVPIAPKKPEIDYGSKVLLVGSCFVENIGKKLEYFRFQNSINPFGILFHPAAILNFFLKVEEEKEYSEEDIFFHNDLWHSFDAHSDFNTTQKREILDALNSAVKQASEFLREATHVVLTPGTAWAYRSVETNKIVANCHKLPQKKFNKELTAVEEDLQRSVDVLRKLNPSAEIILTVSPVRHLKDGFVENQRSKARLISAVHEVVQANERIHYFPAYEIVMDELRDYRFYGEDMVHPNSVAVDYIWQKFAETWISSEAAKTMKEVDSIQKGLSHRPFQKESQAHLIFRKKLEEKIKKLQEWHPNIRFGT